ncbi:CO dehydrogenase nickel-insertion accessory protein CooC [Thermoanaerobacter kivui]|uniref:CO dehydrogenase nickel-insertion accessory protein CooC n=1 Tax=Thermoanaerobacter kivui TaxID=2325 RepID=A0A097ATG7_THEKI|nr:AAA family ATPase [Thermoanaerobacter kivui]AIS53130.1 CO dehydrogenase nickel-insertion accessory protein CooC [Thermoanaerobacter kivui]
MVYVIALAGKGGTGKTTLAGFTIDYLVEKKLGPVLAVDADPNSNLNNVLGLDVEFTLGQIREEVRDDEKLPAGMTKADYLNFMVQQAIVEGNGYDLLVMGRPEGLGCYCFVNGVLREVTDKLSDSYSFLVVDNEAGLEHLSRRTTKKVDLMFAVSECSKRGIDAAYRVKTLIEELKLDVKELFLIVNRVPKEGMSEELLEYIKSYNIPFAGFVPLDNGIYEYDNAGIPLLNLPKDNAAVKAYRDILDKILLPRITTKK